MASEYLGLQMISNVNQESAFNLKPQFESKFKLSRELLQQVLFKTNIKPINNNVKNTLPFKNETSDHLIDRQLVFVAIWLVSISNSTI